MNTEGLIETLAADLRPVHRLAGPLPRAFVWIGTVLALAAVLANASDLTAVRTRLNAAPDLWWATLGAVLTAGCAAVSAFQLSVPGRAAAWMLLPLPSVALWLGASGLGCLRSWVVSGMVPATPHDAMGCATFITLVSAPLSALLLLMLRRAAPLWPGRVAALGGLAAAAAAASLLTLFHPHDASAIDMAMHVLAVGAVVLFTRWAGA